jgi:hypothetical protein
VRLKSFPIILQHDLQILRNQLINFLLDQCQFYRIYQINQHSHQIFFQRQMLLLIIELMIILIKIFEIALFVNEFHLIYLIQQFIEDEILHFRRL